MTYPAIKKINYAVQTSVKTIRNTPWEKFKKIYTPLLCEALVPFTPDRVIANQILTEVFVKVKDIRFWTKQWKPICLSLIQHSYYIAMKHVKIQETLPGSSSSESIQYQQAEPEIVSSHAMQDNAVKTGIPMRHIPSNLKTEINNLKKEGKLETPNTSLSQFHSFLKTFYFS